MEEVQPYVIIFLRIKLIRVVAWRARYRCITKGVICVLRLEGARGVSQGQSTARGVAHEVHRS